MINDCLIINLDSRKDLWNNLEEFRNKWTSEKKSFERIPGVNLKNDNNVLLQLIAGNRININGGGFRKNKDSFLGEIGCYMGHYNCWKYVVDNELDNCLIIEDGVEFLRNDFNNLKINNNIHILFLNEEMNQLDSNKNFIGYGTQGYVVTKKGARKLMEKCHTLIMPIDLQIRHFCNTKEIIGATISSPYLKRNNNRLASIDNGITNMDNPNEKQDTNSIIIRLLTNLRKNNINIDDFV